MVALICGNDQQYINMGDKIKKGTIICNVTIIWLIIIGNVIKRM